MSEIRLNNMIPMETPEGDRAIVNDWDVEKRKKEGWKVIGDPDKWRSTTKAPTHTPDPAIDGKPPAKGRGAKGETKGEAEKPDDSEKPPAK